MVYSVSENVDNNNSKDVESVDITNNNYGKYENENENDENKKIGEGRYENFQMEIKKTPRSLHKHDIFLISLLCFSNFLLGSAYSLIAPFFPTEVSSKSKYDFSLSSI